jgi:hypothetical protein
MTNAPIAIGTSAMTSEPKVSASASPAVPSEVRRSVRQRVAPKTTSRITSAIGNPTNSAFRRSSSEVSANASLIGNPPVLRMSSRSDCTLSRSSW